MEAILFDVALFVVMSCVSGFLLHDYFTTKNKRPPLLVIATTLSTAAAVLGGIVVALHIASL